jgi:ATP-binding cassette subfamily C (CFTR/MRP) protein 5
MRRLVQFVQDNDKVWWHGAILAAGMAGSELMRVLLFGMSWAIAYRTGSRLRSAVMALLYKKVIRLSTLGDKSIGEVNYLKQKIDPLVSLNFDFFSFKFIFR